MNKAKIIVISGPSGAGKTTLLKRLFFRKTIKNNFIEAVSYTTREKRSCEKQGRDYFFTTKKEFLKLKKNKFFLESQKVLDSYYGTPNYFLKKARDQNKDLILCIDVKGGMYLKNNFKGRNRIATIFVSAPNSRELSKRLTKRGEGSNIKRRVKLAKKELQFIKDYDYLIINQNIKGSLRLLEAILIAEKLRRG